MQRDRLNRRRAKAGTLVASNNDKLKWSGVGKIMMRSVKMKREERLDTSKSAGSDE